MAVLGRDRSNVVVNVLWLLFLLRQVSTQQQSDSKAQEADDDKVTSTTPGLLLVIPTLKYYQSGYSTLTKDNYILRRPDSLSESRNEFLINHCSAFCVNKTELLVMDADAHCINAECIPCSCMKPWCYFHNLCCPDIEDRQKKPENADFDRDAASLHEKESSLDAVSSDDGLSIEDEDSVMARQGNKLNLVCEKKVLLIRDCPAEYQDEEIMKKCKEDNVEPTFEEISRVSDFNTSVTYYNTFCAQCNGFEEVTPWEVTISCTNFHKVYTATDELSFLHLSLRPGSRCSVLQDPPLGMASGPECSSQWFENVIDSCYFTEQWKDEDEVLRSLCENTEKELRNSIMYGSYTFSNLYCFMCNSPPMYKYIEPCSIKENFGIGYTPPFSSPFSVLLRPPENEKRTIQSHTYLLEHTDIDLLEQSRAVLCSPGKVLVNNTCVTGIDKIRGLSYKAFIFYTPLYQGKPLNKVSNSLNMTYGDDLLHYFAFEVSSKFEEFRLNGLIEVDSLELRAGQIYLPPDEFQQKNLTIGRSIPLLYLDTKFAAASDSMRNEVEDALVSSLFFETLSYKTDNLNITYLPMISSGNENQGSQCFKEVWYPQQFRCQEILLSLASQYALNVDISELILLNPLLNCPVVKFKSSDYDINNYSSHMTRTGNIILHLHGHAIELHGNWTEQNMIFEDTPKSELIVCNSLLKDKLNNITARQDIEVSLFAKFRFYFSQTCIGLSMFCLILTLITYLAFRVLRSPAGMNNLFLCFSLLGAQAFLLTIVHMRPRDPLCAAMGVMTHFLWLNMFCWAFVCCFHMFQTFTSKTRSGASSGKSKTLSYIKKFTFCTGLPLSVIAAIMIVSKLTKDDGSIGYGKNACYLDSQFLAIVGMVVPLSVMVTTNIVFFVVTVIKIRNVRKLQGNMDVTPGAPKDIYVYVKLSSLTGCFWVFAVGAEYLDSDVLKVVSDILIGLQGVFIFWSYVCNERVRNLYRKAFGMTVVITSRTGTITRVARDVERVEQRKK